MNENRRQVQNEITISILVSRLGWLEFSMADIRLFQLVLLTSRSATTTYGTIFTLLFDSGNLFSDLTHYLPTFILLALGWTQLPPAPA